MKEKMKPRKFRVWDNENKKMIYPPQNDGSYILMDMGGNIAVQTNDGLDVDFVDHLIPMFSTGLLDKNGKEIYEGDILDVSFFREGNPTVIVYWCDIRAKFLVETGFFCGGAIGRDLYYWVKRYSDKSQCEVIGNIHENSELLGNRK